MPVQGKHLGAQLVEAGILPPETYEAKICIPLEGVVTIHIEAYASDRILDELNPEDLEQADRKISYHFANRRHMLDTIQRASIAAVPEMQWHIRPSLRPNYADHWYCHRSIEKSSYGAICLLTDELMTYLTEHPEQIESIARMLAVRAVPVPEGAEYPIYLAIEQEDGLIELEEMP